MVVVVVSVQPILFDNIFIYILHFSDFSKIIADEPKNMPEVVLFAQNAIAVITMTVRYPSFTV